MERLSAAQYGRQSFQRRTHNIVLGLLRSERDAGSLGVEAHQPGLGILRAVLLAHESRPDSASRAELCNLLEEINVRVPEER